MKIKTALIGCGYWGAILKRYIEENPNFSLECVCNSKSDLEEEVWKNKDISAVVVATPNKTHYPIVRAALLSGKHVLSEKPLALKTEECEELRELAKNKNLELVTEYVFTFSRALNKAKKIAGNGKIGNIRGFEMSTKHLGRFGGGSVYFLLGSHMLSVLDMFVPIKGLKFERKDLVTYKGEVETGVIFFENKDISGQIVVSLNYPKKETKITVYGEKGTMVYDSISQPALQVETYERVPWTIGLKLPRTHKEYNIDESNNLKYAIEYFYEVIKGNSKSNIDRAVKISRILESIQKK